MIPESAMRETLTIRLDVHDQLVWRNYAMPEDRTSDPWNILGSTYLANRDGRYFLVINVIIFFYKFTGTKNWPVHLYKHEYEN